MAGDLQRLEALGPLSHKIVTLSAIIDSVADLRIRVFGTNNDLLNRTASLLLFCLKISGRIPKSFSTCVLGFLFCFTYRLLEPRVL